jgi:hypothetical protein
MLPSKSRHFNHPEPEFVNLSRSPGIDSSLAESIPWNRFLSFLNVYKFGLGTVDHRVRTSLQEVETIAKAMRQRKNSK